MLCRGDGPGSCLTRLENRMGPARRVKLRFGIVSRRWGFRRWGFPGRRPRFGRRVAPLTQESVATLGNVRDAVCAPAHQHTWPILSTHGSLEVRIAQTDYEIEAAQPLRYPLFYEKRSAIPTPRMREEQRDFDRHDQFCNHMLVVDRDLLDENGEQALVGIYRLLTTEAAPHLCGL